MCVRDMEEETSPYDVTYRSLTSVADQLISLSSGADLIPRHHSPQEREQNEDHANWSRSISEGAEAPSPCSQEVIDISTVSNDTGPHRLDQYIMSFLKKSPQKRPDVLTNISSSFKKWKEIEQIHVPFDLNFEAQKEEVVKSKNLELSNKCEICNIQFESPKIYKTHMSSCHLKKCQFIPKPTMRKRVKSSHPKTAHYHNNIDSRLRKGHARTGIGNVAEEMKTTTSHSEKDSYGATAWSSNEIPLSHVKSYLPKNRTRGEIVNFKATSSSNLGTSSNSEFQNDDTLLVGAVDIGSRQFHHGMNTVVSSKLNADKRKLQIKDGDITFNTRTNPRGGDTSSCARTLPYDIHVNRLQKLHNEVACQEHSNVYDAAGIVLELASNLEDEMSSVDEDDDEDMTTNPLSGYCNYQRTVEETSESQGLFDLNSYAPISSDRDTSNVRNEVIETGTYMYCARTNPISRHALEINSNTDKATNVKSKLQYWLAKGKQLIHEDFSGDFCSFSEENLASVADVSQQNTVNSHNSVACNIHNHDKETIEPKSMDCGDPSSCIEDEISRDAQQGSDVSSCARQEDKNGCDSCPGNDALPHSEDLQKSESATVSASSTTDPCVYTVPTVKAVKEFDAGGSLDNVFLSSEFESQVTDSAKSDNFKTPDDLCGITSVEITSEKSSAIYVPDENIFQSSLAKNDTRELVPELSDNGWILLDGNVSDYVRCGGDKDDDGSNEDDDSDPEEKGVRSIALYPDDTLCTWVNITDGACARTRLYFQLRTCSSS